MIRSVVVIPAYNPNLSLIKLCSKLSEKKLDILIIDDGSDNNSSDIFSNLRHKGFTVIAHSYNMGKGASLKTAFKYLINESIYSHIITCDADGQHLPHMSYLLKKKFTVRPNLFLLAFGTLTHLLL